MMPDPTERDRKRRRDEEITPREPEKEKENTEEENPEEDENEKRIILEYSFSSLIKKMG
jgi:hypothetical protein